MTKPEPRIRWIRPFPVVFPGKPADIAYDVELYAQMEKAAQTIPAFERELLLNKTSWSQIPLLGTVLQTVQRGLHSIALFYTNRALQHQQTVNWQLWQAVGRLTAVTQQQQRTIETLQAQLAAMNPPD
ncbi:MAG: hypothetical protein R3D55_20090 [Chloroflexota bacterium]